MTRGVGKPKRKPGHRAKVQAEEDRCGSPPLERCPWCGATDAGACCPWANAGNTAPASTVASSASQHAAGGLPGSKPTTAPRRRREADHTAPTAEALGSSLRQLADAEEGWRPVSPRKRKVKTTSGSHSVTETHSDCTSLAADFEQVQIAGSCAAWAMQPTLEADGWVELVATDL